MGFLGGIDVENIIPIIKELSAFKLTDAERAVMENFKQCYQDLPSSDGKKNVRHKESSWKKFRDRFTAAIMLGERVGY